MNSRNLFRRASAFLVAFVLILTLVTPVAAQRGFGRSGGFGGGGRSFSGGRSMGGGSFGGGTRSFGGGGSSSFGSPRSSSGFGSPRTNSSSFGRTGAFGGSGRINSTSISPMSRNGISYTSRTSVMYNGGYYPAYGGGFWGGYSLGMLSSPWYYHWMPFYGGFYVDPPYYDNGVYYAGGFSWMRFIFGILIFCFIIWLISRLFRGGGGRVKYTTYR